MPEPILILTVISLAVCLPSLAKAIWHALKLECHRHRTEGDS